MLPYLLMLGVPSTAAMVAVRRAGALLVLLGCVFFLLIGWRFQVGPDWNSYLYIYNLGKDEEFLSLIASTEPGFRFLIWTASALGGGYILVNVVSAAVFCGGLFTFARRCLEPFLALTVATPYLAIVIGMAVSRQTIAIGVIFYLLATWKERTTLGRTLFVVLASTFHFSALFMLVFVALETRQSVVARALAVGLIVSVALIAPAQLDLYATRYLGAGAITAEGAFSHVLLVAIPAAAYLAVRVRWRATIGSSRLLDNLSIAAIALLAAVAVTPLGADRMSLYFWPVAMHVWSAWPALVPSPGARNGYRFLVVLASFALLLGWLATATNSDAYLPYKNYFWQPEGAPLLRPR